MKTSEAGLLGNAVQLTVVKPLPKKTPKSIPDVREKMSDTTLAKFKNRMERILSALDSEDGAQPMRQLMEIYNDECRLSGMFNGCFISLTISNREEGVA